jgi:uncharacterized protein (DUF1501 family)
VDRRNFLKGSAAITATLGSMQAGLTAVGFEPKAIPNKRTLIYLFLRGGMDGLNLVVPRTGINRSEYEAKRPYIQVPVANLHNLNGAFGLHPGATGLKSLYDSGDLAVVHAVGMPDGLGSRSHFDSQTMYELGTPGELNTTTGWLARHINMSPTLQPNAVMPSFAVGSTPPTSLLGDFNVMTLDDSSSFHPNSGGYGDETLFTLGQMYSGNSTFDFSVQNALDTIELIENLELSIPATYPNTSLADDLGLVASLMKQDVGLQAATVEYGGWDTHNNQGDAGGGGFATRIQTLSDALKAFMDDLASVGLKNEVVVIVQTEFGRRVRENGNRGTDHGTAFPMLVLGGQVNGGNVYGTFPGIRDQDLYMNADLRMTSDFRDVIGEVLINFIGNPYLRDTFPNFDNYTPLGLVPPAPTENEIFSNGFESI